jgi:hypothetical protein
MRFTLSIALSLFLTSAIALAGDAPAKQVDNPEYASWSGFKPGTWIRLVTTSEAAGQTTTMKTTHKLIEVGPEKAVVETTMVTVAMGQEFAMPAQRRDVPAKVTVTEGASDAPKVEKTEGDGDVEVGGKKVAAHWVSTKVETSGMVMVSKTWLAKSIPGGLVRMESTVQGPVSSKSTQVVEDWKAAD